MLVELEGEIPKSGTPESLSLPVSTVAATELSTGGSTVGAEGRDLLTGGVGMNGDLALPPILLEDCDPTGSRIDSN